MNMILKIVIILTISLYPQSLGGQLTTQSSDAGDQDEIELYRQLFLRLNTIMKSDIELKADIQELREEIRLLRESHVNVSTTQAATPSAVPAMLTPNASLCPSAAASTSTSGDPESVHCFGGNWIVIQRRMNGLENFDRNWNEYKNGFGDVALEFFIGLDKLATMTKAVHHELLIVLKDFDNDERYARYDNFQVGGEMEQYRLKELGHYKGNAGDSLAYHKNAKFSTKDRDNDEHPSINCSEKFGGGWWYQACHHSNLNGHYIHTNHDRSYASGIHWKTFRNNWYSLKSAEMMIRPKV